MGAEVRSPLRPNAFKSKGVVGKVDDAKARTYTEVAYKDQRRAADSFPMPFREPNDRLDLSASLRDPKASHAQAAQ